jgi:hypothetical protein
MRGRSDGLRVTVADVRFVREPRDAAYRTLVDVLVVAAAEFFLVVRDQLELGPSGAAVLQELMPFRVRQNRTNAWPGTELIGHQATVSYFRSCAEAGAVLKRACDGLYDWRQPEFPEDLGFLAANGAVVLASVAHEGDAWIAPSAAGYAELAERLGSSYFAAGSGTSGCT